MDSLEFSAAYYEWKTKVSPPFFKEGWLRPPFSLMVLSLCGDGVVKTESGWYFHHLPQIHGKKIPVYQNGSHGFGYFPILGTSSPQRGGEFFSSLMIISYRR